MNEEKKNLPKPTPEAYTLHRSFTRAFAPYTPQGH